MARSSPRSRDESNPNPVPRNTRGGGKLFFLVLFGLLLVGGGIFALVYFLGEKAQLDTEMLAYLPPESNLVIGIEVDDLLKSEKSRVFVRNMLSGGDEDMLKRFMKAGVSEDQIIRIVIGMKELIPPGAPPAQPAQIRPEAKKGQADPVIDTTPQASMVLRTKKPIDKALFIEALGAIEEKRGEKTCYVVRRGNATAVDSLKFIFPSDTLIVVTRNEKVLEKAMSAAAGKPAVSEELQSLAKRVSRGPMWFAMSRKALPEMNYLKIKETSDCPYINAETADAFESLKAMGGWFRFDGDRLDCNVHIVCGDSAVAARAVSNLQNIADDRRNKPIEKDDKLKEFRKNIPDVTKDLYNDIQRSLVVRLSGNVIELNGGFSADNLEILLESLGGSKKPAEATNRPDGKKTPPKRGLPK